MTSSSLFEQTLKKLEHLQKCICISDVRMRICIEKDGSPKLIDLIL